MTRFLPLLLATCVLLVSATAMAAQWHFFSDSASFP